MIEAVQTILTVISNAVTYMAFLPSERIKWNTKANYAPKNSEWKSL